ETRTPTDEMLEGIDTMLVDLQDVGTRVYTYISTLSLLMEKCVGRKIKIVV
ncbi:MAG: exo-beta-N-acetylmuramidase NamZ domain-containing protein, partial [Pseudobdellovibrio sp.]